MKKIKYLILLFILVIPLNVLAKESSTIRKNGTYDADLYTKANMLINDEPIYFDFNWIICSEMEILDPPRQEDIDRCLESMGGANACDENSEPEIVQIEEDVCYAWNVQADITVNISTELKLAINKANPKSVPSSVTCRVMLETTYFQQEIKDCEAKGPDGKSLISTELNAKYLESQGKACLEKKLKGYKNNGLLGSTVEASCTSEKVYLPISQKDKCDPNSLSYGDVKYALKCLPKGDLVKAEHKLTGNMYTSSADNNADAYCIQPGKKYLNNQIYYVDESYDISRCPSSNSSFECGLASILNAGIKDYGDDYATTLIALRLWTADQTGSDGWWEMLSDGRTMSTTEKIFMATVDAINKGYNGTGTPDNDLVLYTKGGAALGNAIELFSKCKSGSLEPVVSGLKANTDTVDFSDGTETITITTPSKVTDVKSSTTKVTVKSINSVQSGDIYITTVVLEANDPDCKIGEFSLSVVAEGAIGGMKRYRPSKGDTYQTMFVYDPNSKDSSINLSTACGQKGNCKNELVINSNVPEDCGGSNEGSIIDPSMDDLLDKCRDTGIERQKREEYNVSDNKYCTLYCREESHLTLMNVAEGLAGRYFSHQLANADSGIVRAKKECVSHIENYSDWVDDFDDAQKAVLKAFSDMKRWEALKEVPNGRTTKYSETKSCCAGNLDNTCLGQIDGNVKTCCDNYITIKEDDCKTDNAYSWGGATYLNCDENSCKNTNASRVTSGKAELNEIDCKCIKEDGDPNFAEKQYEAAVLAYQEAKKTREELYVTLQNCNLYKEIEIQDETVEVSRESVFENMNKNYKDSYSGAIDDLAYEDEEYGDTAVIGTDTKTLMGSDYYQETKWSKADEYLSGGLGGNNEKEITYYKCDNNTCTKIKIKIPENKWARVQVGMEAEFYQSQAYSVQAYTGTVITGSSDQPNYTPLDENRVYPISLRASTGSYEIWYNIKAILERHDKKLVRTAYIGSMTKDDDGVYTCYYNVTNKTIKYVEDGKVGLGFIFRNIDLASVFPSDRPRGENWTTDYAEKVKEEIESLNDGIWTKKAEYSFTITPSNRKKIKQYNSLKALWQVGYTDMSLKCEKGNIECKSNFLTTIKLNGYVTESDLSGRGIWK